MTRHASNVSRPVRAVVGVVAVWICARALALWPGETVAADQTPLPALGSPEATQPLIDADTQRTLKARPLAGGQPTSRPIARGRRIEIALDAPEQPAVPRSTAFGAEATTQRISLTPLGAGAPALRPPTQSPAPGARRLSGSAWALTRGGAAAGLANGGELGGSQAGMRIYYTPGTHALALTARLSAPLQSKRGREAAIGVAIRGKAAGLIVEQRIALDVGGKSAPAAIVYGGVSEAKLGGGLRLDSYVQAGIVGVTRPALFVDGAIRIERTILTGADAKLSAGVALSGGAQPGLSRLDIGPQIVARLSVAGTPIRVAAEWRQRVAGNAEPGSGPAITVGFDF